MKMCEPQHWDWTHKFHNIHKVQLIFYCQLYMILKWKRWREQYGSRSYSHMSVLGKLLLKTELLSVCWDSYRYLCNHIISLCKLLNGWMFFPKFGMILCHCWQLQSLYFEYVSMCVACLVPENSVKPSLTSCILQMGMQYTGDTDAPNVWIIFMVWKYVFSYCYCTVVKQMEQQVLHWMLWYWYCCMKRR